MFRSLQDHLQGVRRA